MNKSEDALLFNLNLAQWKKISTILIWVGVLSWVPFIYLKFSDQNPPLIPFLLFHLTGVIGGARSRSWIRQQETGEKPKADRVGVVGRILVLVGVSAWIPYLTMKYVMKIDVDITPFLSVHLPGVLGGGLMMLVGFFRKKEAEDLEDAE